MHGHKFVPYFLEANHQLKPVSHPEPQGEKVTIDDLIKPPGRNSRPPKLVIILHEDCPGAQKQTTSRKVQSNKTRSKIRLSKANTNTTLLHVCRK